MSWRFFYLVWRLAYCAKKYRERKTMSVGETRPPHKLLVLWWRNSSQAPARLGSYRDAVRECVL